MKTIAERKKFQPKIKPVLIVTKDKVVEVPIVTTKEDTSFIYKAPKTCNVISDSMAYLVYGDSVLIEVHTESTPKAYGEAIILANPQVMVKDSLIPVTHIAPRAETFKIRVINFNKAPKRISKGQVVATALFL